MIPARLNSTRLPNKVLLDIGGKPMIQHVWEQSTKTLLNKVVIATDSIEVYEACSKFGATVEMTSSDHQNGTERIIEVAKKHSADFYINIQGDEPFISSRLINQIVEKKQSHPHVEIITAAHLSTDESEWVSPNVVKVVLDNNEDAIYFSRAMIPFNRNNPDEIQFYRHIGIYGYSYEALKLYMRFNNSTLEKIESLEQLRFIENNIKIKVVLTDYKCIGVDTFEDLERARLIYKEIKKDANQDK
ncbi:3-deoxy-manno-octulosonate cytidylyltransferase [Paenibacillus sp. GCM10023248]|nr:3-deoxy-manno-octulosonate cytidylyltransferase [Paenibacillus sp. MAHUQ-63]MDD9266622.1 3-deoxy-manno-octulosonate cytidylyltransferase [Paenibacillus sp. MAHUQ-63]